MTAYAWTCPHCGMTPPCPPVWAQIGAPGQQPLAPAQPAPRRQQAANGNGRRAPGGNGRRAADPDAPGCIDCGQPVNQRRDGSYFQTCIRCG